MIVQALHYPPQASACSLYVAVCTLLTLPKALQHTICPQNHINISVYVHMHTLTCTSIISLGISTRPRKLFKLSQQAACAAGGHAGLAGLIKHGCLAERYTGGNLAPSNTVMTVLGYIERCKISHIHCSINHTAILATLQPAGTKEGLQ